MRVFMLGWEFPPFISGGLGTACYGLTKAMDEMGMEVVFCLPRMVDSGHAAHVKLMGPDSLTPPGVSFVTSESSNITFRAIDSPLQPYSTPGTYQQQIEETLRQKQKISGGDINIASLFTNKTDYSGDMYTEVHRYAAVSAELAQAEQFDVVHAHDWMTYPAGIAVAAVSGKPLVVHVHSTEFDRSGENVNQMIYDIERAGMERADKVIAVSHFTRNIIISRYHQR